MEQTVNTWNKGLQMDTHPMVQSNDTLSDALNATFVTMNGNEVILQNDMGNRRVDNAFLPPGYQPVGMKEYGGIIYVAAYNPITDKSQIGSFPSPEKKISKMDDESLGGTFDFSSFLSGSNVSIDNDLNLSVIHKDSFMIPLTGDSVLRAGDKFAVYASGLSQMSGLITNYNNIDGISNDDLRAFTPKNKMYTLQLGILNSQNEFVDITKSLCRWESSGGEWYPVTFDKEVSDIYKFNYGYFIPDGFTNPDLSETANDSNFIRERQKIAANTYAYKLIGPLYLKVIYNHIESFNYNIYGIKSENETTLTIEGYITYNCPDNSYVQLDDQGNEYYKDLETGVAFTNIDDLVFDFYHDGSLLSVEETSGRISNVSYNQNTNLYSLKIVKKYTIPQTEGIYEYTIGVLADNQTHNNQTQKIYLKGLSVKGSIDLSLLGSGLASINGWRFYNNLEKETTTLTVSFDAYPEYGKHFGGLYFEFAPAKEDSNGDIVFDWNSAIRYPENGELSLYNGRQTFNFSWNKRFKPRTLYAVTTYYSVYDNITGEKLLTNLIDSVYNPDVGDYSNYRWFLTTELFNEFYQPSTGIDDFCNLGTIDGYISIIAENLGQGTRPNIQKAFEDKMIISLETTNKVSNDSTKEQDIFDGDLTSTETDIEYNCKHEYKVSINSSSEIKIIDEELYPEFIFVKPEMRDKIQISEFSVSKIGNETEGSYDKMFKKCLTVNEGNASQQFINNFKDNLTELEINLIKNGNSLSGFIKYWDRYKGQSQNGISNVKNVFGSLLNDLFKTYIQNNKTIIVNKNVIPYYSDEPSTNPGTFGGMFVNYDSKGGGNDDGHFVDVYTRQSSVDPLSGTNYPGNSTLKDGGIRVYENWHDGAIEAKFKDLKDQVFQYFNVGIAPGQMFLFMNLCHGLYSNSHDRNPGDQISGANFVRVWWKASDSEWALCDKLFQHNLYRETNHTLYEGFRDNYLKKEILKNEDRIYCMYDEYPNELTSIHATDTNRVFYNEFSVPLTIKINYSIKSGTIVADILQGLGRIDGTNLWFQGNQTMPNINPSIVEFILESSKIFQDNVNSFRVDSIENVDMKYGLRYDIEGKPLNRNYMYKYVGSGYSTSDIPISDAQNIYRVTGHTTNLVGTRPYITFELTNSTYTANNNFEISGRYTETRKTIYKTYLLRFWNHELPDENYQNYSGLSHGLLNTDGPYTNDFYGKVPGNGYNLVKIDNNYLKVDSDNKVNGNINTVIYNRKDTIGAPQYRLDHCGNDNHEHTILDYVLTNIVRLT